MLHRINNLYFAYFRCSMFFIRPIYIPKILDYITMIYANECPIVQDLLNQCLSKALRCFIVTVNLEQLPSLHI